MKKKTPKNPTPKPLLKIGDLITVTATAHVFRSKDWDKKTCTEFGPLRRRLERCECEPTNMIIVGARRRLLGTVVSPSYSTGYYGDDEYEPGGINVEETVFVYQARQGFMRKIVEVLPQDIAGVYSKIP